MHPFQPLGEDSVFFSLLERFVVIMYNKTSNLEHVDQARLELFCQRNRGMENLPSTRAALLQHSLRSVYQHHGVGVWMKQLTHGHLYGLHYLLRAKHA